MRKKFKTNFYAPTPVWLRKVGDGLLAASAMITTYAIGAGRDDLALLSMWIGVGGKFLTNVFTPTPVQDDQIDELQNQTP